MYSQIEIPTKSKRLSSGESPSFNSGQCKKCHLFTSSRLFNCLGPTLRKGHVTVVTREKFLVEKNSIGIGIGILIQKNGRYEIHLPLLV